MHSAKTLNMFAVNVRPATKDDVDKFYAHLEEIRPKYYNYAPEEVKLFVRYAPSSFDGSVSLKDLCPLLVFEFLNSERVLGVKERSLMLWGTEPLDVFRDPDKLVRYGFSSITARYTGGGISNPNPDSSYWRFLSSMIRKTKTLLRLEHPNNEDYQPWGGGRDAVIKVIEEGLDKHLSEDSIKRLYKRCKPYDNRYPLKFCDFIIGYFFMDHFLIHKSPAERPKELNPALHNLIKEWIGNRLVIGRPNTEEWWNFSLVRELCFVS